MLTNAYLWTSSAAMFLSGNTMLDGLADAQKNIIDNWLGPVMIVVVAIVGVILLWQRQFRAFLGFLVIATIAGLLIFFGQGMFGKNGFFTKEGKKTVGIKTIEMVDTTYQNGDILSQ